MPVLNRFHYFCIIVKKKILMRKTVLRMRKTLRFRRWSRKAYSILVSLKNHVTVGQVCKSIAEASCKKSSRNVLATECCGAENRHNDILYSDDRIKYETETYTANTCDILYIYVWEMTPACNCAKANNFSLKYRQATAG